MIFDHANISKQTEIFQNLRNRNISCKDEKGEGYAPRPKPPIPDLAQGVGGGGKEQGQTPPG